MHSFLALDMNLIPQSTKDNVPTFWRGVFSNDMRYMLIDGYNVRREIVHTQATLNLWLQWEPNVKEIQEQLISTAIEYTKEELNELQNQPESIWYIEQRSDV